MLCPELKLPSAILGGMLISDLCILQVCPGLDGLDDLWPTLRKRISSQLRKELFETNTAETYFQKNGFPARVLGRCWLIIMPPGVTSASVESSDTDFASILSLRWLLPKWQGTWVFFCGYIYLLVEKPLY